MDTETKMSNRDKEEIMDIFSNDSEDDEVDDEDEVVWGEMLQKVYDIHDESYQSLIELYEEAGMTQDKAENKASDDMRPTYKKSLISSYKKLLIYMNGMENSTYHKKILKDIDRLENNGYPYKKAVIVALKKNKHVFDQIINLCEPDSDDSGEEEEDESDANENDTEEDDTEDGEEDDTENEKPLTKRSKT